MDIIPFNVKKRGFVHRALHLDPNFSVHIMLPDSKLREINNANYIDSLEMKDDT